MNMLPRRPAGRALRRAIPFLLCAVPGFGQFVPNRYTLLLEDSPVAARFASRPQMQSATGIAYRNQIEARQTLVRNELASRGIPVTGSVSSLLNAIFVTAPASRVSEMLSIPGVAGVRPMRRFQMLLNRATQLMNAPAAWTALGGQTNAGLGMKIAIIDTGIDQTHPAFQDATLPAPAAGPRGAYPYCNVPSDCAFTNHKVIVARSYVRQLAGFSTKNSATLPDDTSVAPAPASSQPDDYTPRDRVGHGTGTASAAAGNQNTGTVQFTGMAPKAYLGNYKIFGSPGVNDGPTDDVMILAINDAFNDGMDVASLSVGGSALTGALSSGATCGLAAGQPCDPVAAAYDAAAHHMVVVVSAGNSGSDAYFLYNENYPYFNSISSPATAPSVIGVGATVNSHILTPTVSVNATGAPANVKGLAAQLGDSTFLAPQGASAAPLLDVAQLGNDGHACTALRAYSLYGAYALIQRGPITNTTCTFALKASNAQAAGAIGIVFYTDTRPAVSPSLGANAASFLGPAVMISNGDGLALQSYIDAHPGQAVTVDTAGAETDIAAYDSAQGINPAMAANQLASYSSFGPTPDGAMKPDMVATGGGDVDIAFSSGMYLAAQNFDPNGILYSQNQYSAADGTSFAAPIVAGAAAMVKQAHPTYTTAQIKSALVNSAAQDTTTDDGLTGVLEPVTPQWAGAGRLDAGAAASSNLTVEPATVSFGYLKSVTLPITVALTLTNHSASTIPVTVAVSPNKSAPGTTVAAVPSLIYLAPEGNFGSTGTVNVTLSGAIPVAGSYSGMVTFTASGVTKRVPYLFLVPDGVPYNVVPLFPSPQGTPNQDGGAAALQIVDQYGVPVTGAPVSFTVSPSNGVTFQSVPGEPACSPNNTSSVTCATDSFGIAYAEVMLGATAGAPTITATAAGKSFPFQAFILEQPVITAGQILDNAAFQAAITPGSIAAIKGVNLMDVDLLRSTLGYDEAPPTSPFFPLVLDGVNVSFDVPSAGISVPAPIVAVSPTQVNVVVPWELAGQTSAQVKVTIDEEFGPPIYGTLATATLAATTPAFFTNSGNVADALDVSNQVISGSNPATRGQYIQLYVNGLGPVNNPPASGFPAKDNTSTTTTTPVVLIGGQPATVVFSGIAPTLTIYQVNVQVPSNISPGNQAITISIGGHTSPTGIVIPVQ